MQQLKSRKLSKKAIIIIVGVVIGGLVLSGAGWWYVATQATADYRSQLGSVTSAIREDLKQSSQQLSELAKEKSTLKTLAALKALEETLQAKADSLPALPRVLGITLTPAEEGQKRGQITQYIHACISNFADARVLLDYEASVYAPLQALTLKTGANADQQKELADVWQSVIDRLKNIEPPTVAASVHQQLIGVATSVQSKLAALPDLYSKKDIPGFAAKQKEIEAHINELRGLGGAIMALSVEQDRRIEDSYRGLIRLLE